MRRGRQATIPANEARPDFGGGLKSLLMLCPVVCHRLARLTLIATVANNANSATIHARLNGIILATELFARARLAVTWAGALSTLRHQPYGPRAAVAFRSAAAATFRLIPPCSRIGTSFRTHRGSPRARRRLLSGVDARPSGISRRRRHSSIVGQLPPPANAGSTVIAMY